MRLGKIVAKGVAEDVDAAQIEEPVRQAEAESGAVVVPVTATVPAQAGSSAER